jgi:hypothetical protein
MLDQPKVLQALQHVTASLFHDISEQLALAQQVWHDIQQDPAFAYKVREAKAPWLIPSWTEKLGTTYPIEQKKEEYHIFSVDGSQIYPDRHQGTSCYLINVGSVHIHYNKQKTTVALHSEPHVFVPTNEQEAEESSLDHVNCKRQDFELKASHELIQCLSASEKNDAALLFDGSLIFWHLEGKDPAMKQEYCNRYFQSLYVLYQSKMLTAGYISMPKSKELVNLLKLALADFDPLNNDAHKKIDEVLDAHLANFFLPTAHHSIMFKSNSLITELYPSSLKPYFFYLNTGFEIARIEIPAWIAHNPDAIKTLVTIILDQTQKGRGYPVCLAEAHEQAVVKGPDREFFYHLIQKIGIEHHQRMHISQKSMKKRGIGI